MHPSNSTSLAHILSGGSGTAPRRLHLRASALLALASLGLGACAVGPSYRRKDPSAPSAWSAEATRTGVVDAGTRRDLSEWWRGLADPLLSELVQQALQQGLDLRKARARLREARARRGVAGAERFPSVAATASASRATSTAGTASTTGTQLSADIDASWELDVFGGVRRGVEAAEADLGTAQAGVDDAQVTLVAEVARSYVEVRSLQTRLGIARTNLANQTETLQLTEYRAQAGLVSIQDAEQARSNREQTLAQLPSLEGSLTEAEHRLDFLLGLTPGTLHERLSGAGSLPAVPAQVAVGIPADALRQRPDVRAAERKLAAETARVGVAEAARYPSFKLSGSIGLQSAAQSAGGTGTVLSLLGGITAPIFDAGRLQHQAEAQDAVRQQAELAYQQTVLAALQEAEDAVSALARARERGEALTRAAEAARTAEGLARQRYGAGVIDFQAVIDTERTLLTVEDDLAGARTDEVLALIRLYKALGGGWSRETDRRVASRSTP